MNYFVTGGTGFIGRFLLARLLRQAERGELPGEGVQAETRVELLA